MNQSKISALTDYVNQFMEEHNVPGLSIAISHQGEVIYQNGFGVRDHDRKEPVTPETLFGIASVSKSFAAVAIMQLVAEGKLSVDDPVSRYVPSFRIGGKINADRIKIRHLLSHTSGVPPLLRREELTKLNDHLAYLGDLDIDSLGEPGEYFSYCNDMFLLLGAIIERVTGRLFRRYVTEQLLEPLHMHRSTFSLEEVARLHNVSVPYVQKGNKQVEPAPWPALGNYEVGGGIRSNVLDLMQYGQIFVNARQYQEKEIASESLLRSMWQPVHRLTRNAWYGYALRMVPDYSGVTLVEHGGGQPGVSSNFGFVPEKGLVVAVLCNLDNVPIRNVWLAAVNAALELPLDQKDGEEPSYEASKEELDRLVGTYQSAEGGNLRLFQRDGIPVADVAGTEFELRASGSDTLVFLQNGSPLRFFFKAERQAWAVLLGMRMLVRAK
ncbi:serine hydrolase domain-containing protein [Brevibacillus sp. NRS-1366]|uniref:serine hydrolase domain-containing protein n=1 Tax=Brevibacillus sp. NRS-1366 TaxID=3233899 RepID=UPI003D2302FF